jgi:hypothetical protein
MSLEGAVADVLATFKAAGVHAVADPRDLNTPCAYVIPPEGSFRFDRGRLTIDWVAYLVVGDTGATSATSALSKLVDAVAGVLPFTTFARDAIADPNGGDPMPAYRLVWTSTITIGA